MLASEQEHLSVHMNKICADCWQKNTDIKENCNRAYISVENQWRSILTREQEY